MRGKSLVLVAIAACAPFKSDREPGIDAGQTSGASSSGSTSSSTSSSSSGGPDAGDWPIPQPPGAACATRRPVPRRCDDYEGEAVDLSTKVTYGISPSLKVLAPGSNSEHALVTTANSGAAFYVVPTPGATSRIAWSFDLRRASLGADVEIGELNLPLDKGECALQIHFRNTPDNSIHLNEFCDGGEEETIATLAGAAALDNEWINIFVDAELDMATVALTVTTKDAPGVTASGKTKSFKITDKTAIRVGATYSTAKNGSVQVMTDNFAVYWR